MFSFSFMKSSFCCAYIEFIAIPAASFVDNSRHLRGVQAILVMRRSIRNFNIPPGAYPGHLTVHRARGGGNLNVVFEGWGI